MDLPNPFKQFANDKRLHGCRNESSYSNIC